MNDDATPVVSTATRAHHPNAPDLTVWANWPFDELFGEVVKSEFPKGERRYSPGEFGRPAGWWFTPGQMDRLVGLLADQFGRVRVVSEDGEVLVGPGGEVIEDEQQTLF